MMNRTTESVSLLNYEFLITYQATLETICVAPLYSELIQFGRYPRAPLRFRNQPSFDYLLDRSVNVNKGLLIFAEGKRL